MKRINIIVGLALMLLALMVVDPVKVQAQRTMLSSYDLPSDTVTNTATGYLQLRVPGNSSVSGETLIQVVVTEISGTTGGTVSILGSLDGTNFIALKLREVATAVNTFTPADQAAAQTYMWRIVGNPALYYRVSYTGTGTMSTAFSAKLLVR